MPKGIGTVRQRISINYINQAFQFASFIYCLCDAFDFISKFDVMSGLKHCPYFSKIGHELYFFEMF